MTSKLLMRAAFAGGGSSPSGAGVEGGDVLVARRGFLGFELEQPWRASGREGKSPADAMLFRPGVREVLIGALVGVVILSSARVVSFHSRSGSPLGWVQALRKWEKAPHSPYFF
jgi:hypothetical protein